MLLSLLLLQFNAMNLNYWLWNGAVAMLFIGHFKCYDGLYTMHYSFKFYWTILALLFPWRHFLPNYIIHAMKGSDTVFFLLLHHMTWLYIRLSLNDRNDCVDLVGANRINCESSLCLQDRFMPDQRSSAYYGLSTRYQCVCRIFDVLWKLNLSLLSHVSSWWSSLFIHHCCVLSNT